MLSFSLCLFILSLVVSTLVLQPFHVTSAPGGAMIIDVCNKSPNPDRCKACLQGNPKGPVADIRGLAMMSIACGKRNAYGLYSKTYATIIDTNDKALKELLSGDFYDELGSTAYDVGNAGPLLQSKGVEAAKQSIRVDATEHLTKCSELLKKPGVAVPKIFTDGLNDIGTDCGIILAILDRVVR